jgi:hypothetical protein
LLLIKPILWQLWLIVLLRIVLLLIHLTINLWIHLVLWHWSRDYELWSAYPIACVHFTFQTLNKKLIQNIYSYY